MLSSSKIVGLSAFVLLGLSSFARADDAEMAMNEPDRFNWSVFVQVNAAAADGKNRVWETWADNSTTFPAQPSRTVKPKFPDQAPPRSLEVVNQQTLRAAILGRNRLRISKDGSEEVRRNRSSFDFIVNSNLYYREGITAAVNSQKQLSFPSEAIELKAVWKPLDGATAAQKARYYVNKTADGREFGLAGLHVMTKAVLNWTWATFEHTDNPGRCDIIGCHDAFGAEKADVKSNDLPDKGYPECKHTAALDKMFVDAGLKEGFWAFYCLKGSQIEFADQSAWGTRLGNSVIESGFVDTSSCMSCHSRSAFNSAAKTKFSGGFNPDGTGPVGFPEATTFFNVRLPADFTKPRPSYQFLPMDFVWSFTKARSAP
ncbi:hypothetical protein QA649_11315 [Bradyrhizobium sp. CB1717]|uniref:hypothetical protein n=1 Tax=Bradyrhizobium sp. CB1717 TaxID=3039154 RepID=UPI0024B0E6A9|nr:hypothetical protein [Bradyrhizobium sp. CB1717]WFU26766.1 hypothetical protein QA649_11315 [Bradyrhizobium sp. CB1717]